MDDEASYVSEVYQRQSPPVVDVIDLCTQQPDYLAFESVLGGPKADAFTRAAIKRLGVKTRYVPSLAKHVPLKRSVRHQKNRPGSLLLISTSKKTNLFSVTHSIRLGQISSGNQKETAASGESIIPR